MRASLKKAFFSIPMYYLTRKKMVCHRGLLHINLQKKKEKLQLQLQYMTIMMIMMIDDHKCQQLLDKKGFIYHEYNKLYILFFLQAKNRNFLLEKKRNLIAHGIDLLKTLSI